MTGQVVATSALAPAEIGTRVIAYIVDLIILGLVYLILVTVIAVGSAIQGDSTLAILATRSIIFAIVSVLYFGYGWTSWRASAGQRFLGLQTVNVDGSTLNWNKAITRWAYLFGPSALQSLFGNADQIGGVLSFLVGCAVLAYYIYLLWTTANDPKRQGFHDKQSGTMVVKAATA
jgi:uncharacterized RDD family membrane protein YckC